MGGLGFDTRESGTSQFVELGVADLYASLSGTVSTTRWVNVNATNTSALSGSAFSGASGNIGVNVAAGTGNLQANSLAWQSPSPAPAAVVAAASKRNTPVVRQWPGPREPLFLLPLGQGLPLLPENAMFGHRLSIRLLACLLLLGGASARAGDVGFAGVLPNGAAAAEGGEHAGTALPQRGTPAHRLQLRAAALATLLRHAYHLDTDEATVIEGMMGCPTRAGGRARFSLLDIKRYVESLGMRGRGYRIDEARLRTLRVPGLVLMDVRGFRHFVVLKQVRDGVVEVADPILGNRSLALPEFLAAWPSRAVFVVIGSDFDRNTVLLQPSERPSARALYARQGPITDAELVDFGFSHADLF